MRTSHSSSTGFSMSRSAHNKSLSGVVTTALGKFKCVTGDAAHKGEVTAGYDAVNKSG